MEDISIISWNICRGIASKLESQDFLNIITKHDIVCLYECWIEENVLIELEGYECFAFPRVHGKGGGIVIFIRSTISNNCCIVENIYDNIVLIKLSRAIFKDDTDVYIFSCYFPPINSTFYEKCENDLFMTLEEMVAMYKGIGKVFVFGDFNSRTADKNDFIQDDTIGHNSVNGLSNISCYVPDINNFKRKSSDNVLNQFGRQLLSLCKSTSLRIINGRHQDDPNGSITFYNHNGSSLIDYVMTFDDSYDSIVLFESGVFNAFSDHSPICISLRAREASSEPQSLNLNHN